jgi:PTS system mannose-specific IIA component
MIGVLVVSHGALADELVAAARVIAGELPGFRSLPLDWHVGLEEARVRIAEAIGALEQGDGVLVLTDLYGATPSNAAFGLAVPGHVEVISGVNLPMLVRLGCTATAGVSLSDLARAIELKGRRSICRAGALSVGAAAGSGDG